MYEFMNMWEVCMNKQSRFQHMSIIEFVSVKVIAIFMMHWIAVGIV